MQAKLYPGRVAAALHRDLPGIEVFRAGKALPVGVVGPMPGPRTAGDENVVVPDVGPAVDRRVQVFAFAGTPVQPEIAQQVRHELVALAVARTHHAAAASHRAHQPEIRIGLHPADDVLGEVQIPGVGGPLVEHDHRLEQRGRGYPLPRSVFRDVRPVPTVDLDQQVGHSPAGVDHPLVREHRLEGEQAVEVVAVGPDVPAEAVFATRRCTNLGIHVVVRFRQGNVLGRRHEGGLGCIGAEIAVRQLRGQQTLDVAFEFRPELAVAGREPSERRGMQPLAEVFALPRMHARSVLEAVDQVAGLRHVPQPMVAPQIEPGALQARNIHRANCLPRVHRYLSHLPSSSLVSYRRNRQVTPACASSWHRAGTNTPPRPADWSPRARR